MYIIIVEVEFVVALKTRKVNNETNETCLEPCAGNLKIFVHLVTQK